jgi:hypothetical protein
MSEDQGAKKSRSDLGKPAVPGPRLLDPPNGAGSRLVEELESLAPELRDRFVASLLLDLRPDDVLSLLRLSDLVEGWPRLEAELEKWGAEAEGRWRLWRWVVTLVGPLLPDYLEGVRRLAEMGRGPSRPGNALPSVEDEARGRQLLDLWRSPRIEAFWALDRSCSEASLRFALRAARAGDDRFSILELAHRVARLADWRLGLKGGLPLDELVDLQDPAGRFAENLLDLCVAECAEAEVALETG